jgi:hypothetical protein
MDNPLSFLNREVTPIHSQKDLAAQLRSSERALSISYASHDKLSP